MVCEVTIASGRNEKQKQRLQHFTSPAHKKDQLLAEERTQMWKLERYKLILTRQQRLLRKHLLIPPHLFTAALSSTKLGCVLFHKAKIAFPRSYKSLLSHQPNPRSQPSSSMTLSMGPQPWTSSPPSWIPIPSCVLENLEPVSRHAAHCMSVIATHCMSVIAGKFWVFFSWKMEIW
jgi:hypothetical protein